MEWHLLSPISLTHTPTPTTGKYSSVSAFLKEPDCVLPQFAQVSLQEPHRSCTQGSFLEAGLTGPGTSFGNVLEGNRKVWGLALDNWISSQTVTENHFIEESGTLLGSERLGVKEHVRLRRGAARLYPSCSYSREQVFLGLSILFPETPAGRLLGRQGLLHLVLRSPALHGLCWWSLAMTPGRSPSGTLGLAKATVHPLTTPGSYLAHRVQTFLSFAQEGTPED